MMINLCSPKILSASSIKELLGYDINPTEFSLDKVLDCGFLKKLGMQYAIIYHYDSVETDIIENVDMSIENIIEARFFAEDREIRIFNDESEISGTILRVKEDNEKLKEEYYLFPRSNENRKYPLKLIVNKYFGYDVEDNQAYICYVAPAKLIF